MNTTIRLLAKPHSTRHGDFEAWLDGECLCVSATPLLSAARILAARGVADETILVLRHAGSDFDALRTTVGTAARLAVSEGDQRGLFFTRYRPFPSRDDPTPWTPEQIAILRRRGPVVTFDPSRVA